MFRRSSLEMRVLILAPIGRDARLLANTLAEMDVEPKIAENAEACFAMLAEGAGTALLAEEALDPIQVRTFSAWLSAQPPWSDLPLLILTRSGRPTLDSQRRAHELETIGNITLIERPARPETVQSSVRAALRARMRQYEIRSSQEALLRANADLEQFAYSASHDLREPLRSIGIYSDLLARDYGDSLGQKGSLFLSHIRSSVTRTEILLSDLLAYAHASSISDELPPPIEAAGPVDAALENLAGAIQESGARIDVGDMPAVRIRKSHLEQVFQNLVGNAIKYRREEPVHVRLAARREDTFWLFWVEDNGIGIPAEYRETVFGIFKRLHTNAAYSGTGMGLAICQRIIERYRGRIWVESELGRGSKFLFTIPA